MTDYFVLSEEHAEVHGAEHHDGEGHHGGHHHSTQPLIILFVFVGLLIGGALRELNKKTKFPYTPMLIIAGIILGHWRESLGVIGQSTTILSHINPHMLLFIFIPVLIFESGFNCDWYIFKKALFNIILLAGPGVLFGAFLLACCLKWVCGYTWEDDQVSWAGALTMGSILSATDPVAVVALLKELGASIRFGHLIEGESLLNDGVAMVFYQVFVELAKPGAAAPTASGITLNLIRIAGGGPLLGFLMGLVGSLWLRRVIRDDVLTSTITFISCYIIFYIAEFTFMHVSGILAIVVLGLFMSAFGKTKIYSESEHAVHTVWAFAQYGCETLIFLLTGVLIGIEMMDKSTITSDDWIKMFIFYLCMIVMRFIMVAVFYKLLATHGYGLSSKEFWVLIWGGLRGALGLTLALMVGVDMELPQRLRELTVFYMSGTATLTLLVNGTTCAALVRKLGMVEDPQIRRRILNTTLQRLVITTSNKQEELKNNKYLNLANWDLVSDMIGEKALKQEISPENEQPDRNSFVLGQSNRKSVNYQGLEQAEVHQEARLRILRLCKGLFWERYEEGQVGGEAVRMLEEGCNICLDNTREELCIWDNVYSNFTGKTTLSYFFKMKDWVLVGPLARGYITRHLAFIYEVATTFIIGLKEAKEILEEFPIKKEWINQVYREVNQQIQEAEKFVANLSDDYSNIIQAIHTKRASISILEYHKKFLSEYKHKGYIDDKDYEILRKQVDRKIVNIENHVFKWDLPQFEQYVVQFPVFSSLSQSGQNKISSQRLVKREFQPGEEIFTENAPFFNYYVIVKGTVSERIGDDFQVKLGTGSFINFANVTAEDSQSVCSCRAETAVVLSQIDYDLISEFMDTEEKFRTKVYKQALYYYVHKYAKQAGPLLKLTEDRIQHFVNNATLEVVQNNQIINLENGGYLFKGELSKTQQNVEQVNQGDKKKSYSFIEPRVEYINLTSKAASCVILKFGENLYHRQSIRDIINQQDEDSIEKQYLSEQIKNTASYQAPSGPEEQI